MKEFGYGNSDPNVANYVEDLIQPIDAPLQKIIHRMRARKMPLIQLAPMDAKHIQLLVAAAKPKRVVEIGTLGGYSGVCLLRAMPQEGHLWTLEKDEAYARFATQTFQENGVLDRVSLLVGAALDNLVAIADSGPFDFVLIDADKPNYPAYARWAVENLAPGGIIVGDNTFAFGTIHQTELDHPNSKLMAESLRDFNAFLANQPECITTVLPTKEGLTVAVKVREADKP